MLRWLCIILSLFHAHACGSFVPGDLEIDIIFPKAEETYAPSEYTPFVFAIHNPALATHFRIISGISVMDKKGPSVGEFVAYNNTWNKHTDENLHLYYWGTNEMNKEADWDIEWDFLWPNSSYGTSKYQGFTFRTRNNSQPMNLVDATSEKKCNKTCSLTMSVKGLSQFENNGVLQNYAELSWPDPKPNPCKAKIDSKQASKIMSDIKKNHDGAVASRAISLRSTSAAAVSVMMGWLLLFCTIL